MVRQKILAFLIAVLPVAYIYSFPIFINNLGHAILLFLIFPMLIADYTSQKKTKENKKTNRYYVFFCLYLITISLLSPLINGFEGEVKELFSAAEFSVIVYFLINDKKIGRTFVDIYIKLAIFFALFLLLQYVAFIFFGVTISGVIPFLEEYNREVESVFEGRILRISSAFAESSHFAVYEIPALLMLLFGKTKSKCPIIWIVILSISVLLSTSSNGILIMGMVYIAYIYSRFFNKLNIAYIVIGGVILVSGYYLISRSQFIEDVTYGLFVQESDMTTSKAEMRIYRGFNMYADMPTDKKVFGIGWRNAQDYCKTCNNQLFSKYAADVFDYFNSIAGTLIYTGLIGLTFLTLFFYTLFKRVDDFCTKTLIACVFILMGSSSILMSDQWIFFLATITSMININSNEKNNSYIVAQRHSNSQQL